MNNLASTMMPTVVETLGRDMASLLAADLIAHKYEDAHNRQVEAAMTEHQASRSDDDVSDEIEDATFTCAPEDFELFINKDLTLRMTQAPTPFNGIFQDDTGSVIWGASVCLARYLTPTLVQNKRIMELGCGGGAPSLVACKYGAQTLLATDFQIETLNRMQHHAEQNDCPHMQVRFLDWQHLPTTTTTKSDYYEEEDLDDPNYYVADIILASDVIYGNANVTAFIQTIQKYLSDDESGSVLFATRDGRQNVDQVLTRMPKSGFVEVERIKCDNGGVIDRWRGDHTIHIFKRESSDLS